MDGFNLKGKTIKDYNFGDSIEAFGSGSLLAQATKLPNLALTVYAIPNTLIDNNLFQQYNQLIVANSQKFFPTYHEIVISKNFVYMIFEELAKPTLGNPTEVTLRKFVSELKRLLPAPTKLSINHVFKRVKSQGDLCVVVPYTDNW
jgi:hypothetical protein